MLPGIALASSLRISPENWSTKLPSRWMKGFAHLPSLALL